MDLRYEVRKKIKDAYKILMRESYRGFVLDQNLNVLKLRAFSELLSY